jgi:acetyl esterase/lipase
MQILVPRSEARTKLEEAYPIVIYSIGGGWQIPLVHYRLPGIVGLAKRGFVVAAVEYRGRQYFSNWREAVEDVRSAVRYMRKHAAAYNGDPDKIVLMGDSAGGHLSMLASYTGNEFDSSEDDLTISANVSGVMELFSPTDLVGIMRESCSENRKDHPLTSIIMDTFTELVKTKDPEEMEVKLEALSVLNRVSANSDIPPTLIAQGDKDIIVPVWNAEALYTKLSDAGKYAEFYLLRNARHGDMRFYDTDMLDRYERFITQCTR